MLMSQGVCPQKAAEKVKGILSGKTCLITGTLSVPRSEMETVLKGHGAKMLSAVSKNLDYLIVGVNPGSKVDKAKALGLTILTEEEIPHLLN